jgi:hypothetical protein
MKNFARNELTLGKASRKTAWFAYSIRSFGAGVPVRASFHGTPAPIRKQTCPHLP